MIITDMVRERIKKLLDTGGERITFDRDILQSMYDMMVDHQERRWIPVEERMPEEYTDVMMYISFNEGSARVWQGFFRSKDKWCYADGQGINDAAVTHWRPLPPPPEKDV